MGWTNYHNHCRYCDGVQSAEDHVLGAIEQGVGSLAFTCHAPVPFESTWNMDAGDLPQYLAEIESLKEKYRETIELHKSLEIDFIAGVTGIGAPIIESADLDFTLGSVHYLSLPDDSGYLEIDGHRPLFAQHLEHAYTGDIQSLVEQYYGAIQMMVRDACPDIVGHLDKIKMQNQNYSLWNETDKWYRSCVLETLEVIRTAGAIVEVNTRGMYSGLSSEPYPSRWILTKMKEMGIAICLNSDAHHPDEITGRFPEATRILLETGFRHLHVRLDNGWAAMPFDHTGLHFSHLR